MKNKKFIVLAASVLLIGLTTWYFWSVSEPLVVQQVDQAEKVADVKPSFAKELNRLEKQASPQEKEIATKVLEKIVQSNKKLSTISKVQQAQNMPIEFYGKVIDQHGEPVSGVKVHYTIAAYEGVISSGPAVRNYWVNTDSNGAFSITGTTGERIGIRDREKFGYEFEKTFPYYEMSKQWVGHKLKSKGSPDKPVIFHAWKKIEAEKLIYSEGFYGFYLSGKPYTIDLQKGKKIEGVAAGDLEIIFERSPNGKRFSPSDWAVVVKAKGGGISETSDLFMNEAPNQGYVTSWGISLKKDSLDFQKEIERNFYLKSRNGNAYSKVKMRFIPYYKDDVDVIEIKAWLNPNGSRNLQYDSRKRISLQQ